MAQSNFYPPQAASCANINSGPMCTHCNLSAPHTNSSGCTSTTSYNAGKTNYDPCSAYCQVSCNTVCNTAQAYCNIGRELITSHGDVGAAPQPGCIAQGELIFKGWSAQYWNAVINKLNAAEGLGKTSSQGSTGQATPVAADPTNTLHPANSLITAEKYNQIRQKFSGFSQNYVAVNRGDVIKAAHAAAMQNAMVNARFRSAVCDVCNTAGQTNGSCNCNCPCPCSCDCGCPCSCSCDCSCDCDCNCDCNCDCDCNCSDPGGGG